MKFEIVKSESIATFGFDIEKGAVIIKFLKWHLWIQTNKIYEWFKEKEREDERY